MQKGHESSIKHGVLCHYTVKTLDLETVIIKLT